MCVKLPLYTCSSNLFISQRLRKLFTKKIEFMKFMKIANKTRFVGEYGIKTFFNFTLLGSQIKKRICHIEKVLRKRWIVGADANSTSSSGFLHLTKKKLSKKYHKKKWQKPKFVV